MATKSNVSSPTVLATHFKKLSQSAAKLNAASDELARAIVPIDDALKQLNLGIPTWHAYEEVMFEDGSYRSRYIGYAKINGKWGLALGEESGHESYGIDSSPEWLFNEAPRFLRLEALDHLPTLLDALCVAVEKAAEELEQKTKRAREYAESVVVATTDDEAPW